MILIRIFQCCCCRKPAWCRYILSRVLPGTSRPGYGSQSGVTYLDLVIRVGWNALRLWLALPFTSNVLSSYSFLIRITFTILKNDWVVLSIADFIARNVSRSWSSVSNPYRRSWPSLGLGFLSPRNPLTSIWYVS